VEVTLVLDIFLIGVVRFDTFCTNLKPGSEYFRRREIGAGKGGMHTDKRGE
jgi:hypothetical protein